MIERPCPITRVTPDDGAHYFFGYYDKSPWNRAEDKLLVHRTSFCDRFPEPEDEAELGFVDPKAAMDGAEPVFTKVATTRAWNWQQGAQLRWWTDVDGFEGLMFNDRDDTGAPITRVVDVSGEEVHRVATPLVALSPDGRTGLSISFGRLTRLKREYGLPGVDDAFPNDPSPQDDGVWRVDLASGARKRILTIHQLDAMGTEDGAPAGGDLHQHVNHLMFNPSGTRFCFMHRFARADGIQHSRLFTSDLDAGDVRLLFEGMCSHYDWADDSSILAWAGKRALLGGATESKSPAQKLMTLARKGLKPVYYALGKPRILMNKIMKDSYLLIPDEQGGTPTEFAKGELTTDGHCTFNRGGNHRGVPEGQAPGRWVLTDGYPDMKSRQPLFLWDTKAAAAPDGDDQPDAHTGGQTGGHADGQGYEIGRYFTPRELDGELRVDLHPRFNADATRVCVDSAQSGGRAVYVVDVSSITGGSDE